jgi:hypothetical protein
VLLQGLSESGGRFKPVFSAQMEDQLKTYCLDVDGRYFGLTLKDVRRLAYQLADSNKLDHPFKKEAKLAGKEWAYAFIKRHGLALRTPEPTSIGRAMGFNRVQVGRFYELLREELTTNRFTAGTIFNVDETGLSTVPNHLPKVVSMRGKRAVNKVVSGERGLTVTAVCCFSAGGTYVPPALIFPRKRLRPELMDGAPAGSLGLVSDSGFINQDLFVDYMKHFISHVRPDAASPVLLILDNHSSHISIPIIELCRSSHVHLLSIPPHSSHRIQPLDVVFYGPLKTTYAAFCDTWQVSNPGRAITQFNVAALFKQAYERCATLEKASKGFSTTGIWPFNSDIFTDNDFLPATVTERDADIDRHTPHLPILAPVPLAVPSLEHSYASQALPQVNLQTLPALPQFPPLPTDMEPDDEDIEISTVHHQVEDITADSELIQIDSGETGSPDGNVPQIVTPQMIRPFPRFDRTKVASGRSQKASLITGSPFKQQLLDKNLNKKPKPKGKVPIKKVQRDRIRPKPKPTTPVGKPKGTFGRKAFASKMMSLSPPALFLNRTAEQKAFACRSKPGVRTARNLMVDVAYTSTGSSTTRPTNKRVKGIVYVCPGCSEVYPDPPTEPGVKCSSCDEWWHEACTSYEGGPFICDLCE